MNLRRHRVSSSSLSSLDPDGRATLRRSDTLTLIQGIWQQMAPQVQAITLVTEDGAIELVMESRKPKARAFRHWLLHEVWPSIRDTGIETHGDGWDL